MKDFSNDISIDQDRLDYEWQRQPLLYLQYAEDYADYLDRTSRAKDNLDFVKAEVDTQIRNEAAKAAIKMTEAKVSAAVLVSKEYGEALNEYQNNSNKANELKFVLASLDHKKKALENLTTLWLNAYFSSPRADKETKEKMAEKKRELVRNNLKKEQ